MALKVNVKVNMSLTEKLNIDKFKDVVNEETERQLHESSSKTARYAPRKTGALANSFPASVEMVNELKGQYGSDLDYATIQEFINQTRSGFVRKTVLEDTPAYKTKLKASIKRAAK
ncbi:hypothetical protein LL50_05565 [Listeria monocytogenes]|nr:hypothetical protein [Listeria monocytogenes]EAD0383076.1 hypothetical protein [Listeria monocytogenes]EAD9128489.1 hypothetical protein [Listeria monocytogenes]